METIILNEFGNKESNVLSLQINNERFKNINFLNKKK